MTHKNHPQNQMLPNPQRSPGKRNYQNHRLLRQNQRKHQNPRQNLQSRQRNWDRSRPHGGGLKTWLKIQATRDERAAAVVCDVETLKWDWGGWYQTCSTCAKKSYMSIRFMSICKRIESKTFEFYTCAYRRKTYKTYRICSHFLCLYAYTHKEIKKTHFLTNRETHPKYMPSQCDTHNPKTVLRLYVFHLYAQRNHSLIMFSEISRKFLFIPALLNKPCVRIWIWHIPTKYSWRSHPQNRPPPWQSRTPGLVAWP